MMNQQPDKFFRQKLENLQVPAPPAAWDRIDAGLSKKSKPAAYWLKIAASFLIVATAAFILWPNQHGTEPAVAVKENTPSKVDTTITKKKIAPAESTPAVKENLVAEKKDRTSSERKSPTETQQKEKRTPVEEKTQEPVVVDQPVAQNQSQVVPNTPEVISPNAVAVVEEKVSEEKNIKITITAAESEKFLNKKTLAEATPAEKKTSTLHKLLDKAEDLASNQEPFGDLRQKKNEILALNFRSEKQRGQNK